MRLQVKKPFLKVSLTTALKQCVVVSTLAIAGMTLSTAHANEEAEALKAKLAEAERLLAADKSSHDETAEKKKAIDDKLAARQEREAEILEELKKLCEDQDKLKPGSLDACMAKLGN